MSNCMRKPTIWPFNQVRHKPGCTATENSETLETQDFRRGRIVLSV